VVGSNPSSIEEMDSSNPFLLIKDIDSFTSSFSKLGKSTPIGSKQKLVSKVDEILKSLIDEQRPSCSRQEPCPKIINLPPLCEFRKIEFIISKGASGQIRLMYFVDFSVRLIKPLWIYSHEQFSKRPPESDLVSVIKEILEY
jgi:hypothetical protein